MVILAVAKVIAASLRNAVMKQLAARLVISAKTTSVYMIASSNAMALAVT